MLPIIWKYLFVPVELCLLTLMKLANSCSRSFSRRYLKQLKYLLSRAKLQSPSGKDINLSLPVVSKSIHPNRCWNWAKISSGNHNFMTILGHKYHRFWASISPKFGSKLSLNLMQIVAQIGSNFSLKKCDLMPMPACEIWKWCMFHITTHGWVGVNL